mmetsp:Transcript_11675/g.23046  ORF Transcript_11675/g.23046 Transcript_11675/m.23046 type:complete len:223 (-) Transcript_11675:193-861(-)
MLTRASSYSSLFCAWTILRRDRISPCLCIGSISLGLGSGSFIPMKTSSSSLICRACFIVLNPRNSFWITTAALSGSVSGCPTSRIFFSRSSCFLISFMNLARWFPCLPRSLTWMMRMASSMDMPSFSASASGSLSASRAAMSVCTSFSLKAKSFCRSSTKYRGTGSSRVSGMSLRSTRMSSKFMNLRPDRLVRYCLISSIRPMTASSTSLTSSRFCGWTCWS